VGERTSYPPGTFCFADLGTTDADGAKSFYGAVFGWELEDVPVPDAPPYTLAKIGGKTVAALYQRGEDVPGPPAWLSYVTVEDAEASAAGAAELGATTIDGARDVMGIGRMAVLQDPTGAVFAIWQPIQSIGAELVNDPGAITLNQLNTGDTDGAQSFYTGLFGWRFEAVEASGEQPFWGIYNGERLNGGMMPLPPGEDAPPHWLVYFTSTDLEDSVGRITGGGGGVLIEPMAIPTGRIAIAADPQGAAFALFQGEVDP
jgi:predicted enzyme related to lactoylglutathione lyase